MLDNYCRKLCARSQNLLIAWWMMAQYAYRIESDPILSDDCFDWLCREALRRYDEITHEHKRYATVDNLRTGSDTGFGLEAQYPRRVVASLRALRASRRRQ